MIEKIILLVFDNNQDLLVKIKSILEPNHYKVLNAPNGKNAIQKLKLYTKLPDLILTSMLLNDMSGFELLEIVSLNEDWNHIPFMFLSSIIKSNESMFGTLNIFDEYFFMPLDENNLLNTLNLKIEKKYKIESYLNDELKFKSLCQSSYELDFEMFYYFSSPIYIFLVQCDKYIGPVLMDHYSENPFMNIFLEKWAIKLYKVSVQLFDNLEVFLPESMFLSLNNIQMDLVLVFDAITDRFCKTHPTMIGILAPEISFLNSLKIKYLLSQITTNMKNFDFPNLVDVHNEASIVLTN